MKSERDTISFKLLERLTLRYLPGVNDPVMFAAIVHIEQVKRGKMLTGTEARWRDMLHEANLALPVDWPVGVWCD